MILAEKYAEADLNAVKHYEHERGLEQGLEQGRNEGILNTIEICLDLNLGDDEIAKRVSEKFDIPEDTIKEKYLKDK